VFYDVPDFRIFNFLKTLRFNSLLKTKGTKEVNNTISINGIGRGELGGG